MNSYGCSISLLFFLFLFFQFGQFCGNLFKLIVAYWLENLFNSKPFINLKNKLINWDVHWNFEFKGCFGNKQVFQSNSAEIIVLVWNDWCHGIIFIISLKRTSISWNLAWIKNICWNLRKGAFSFQKVSKYKLKIFY